MFQKGISLQSTMPVNKHPREVPWIPSLNIIKIKSIFFILSLKCMLNFIHYKTFRLETVIQQLHNIVNTLDRCFCSFCKKNRGTYKICKITLFLFSILVRFLNIHLGMSCKFCINETGKGHERNIQFMSHGMWYFIDTIGVPLKVLITH